MARRPDRIRIEVFGPASEAKTAKHAVSPSNEAILSLARLIGRQMARKQFERARYSSDNQREASIDDQFRICREHAKREKWKVVGAYKDAGISGASMILRPGIQTLLQDAQAGRFDIVLAEALDRISRDQADVATLFKHLKFAGVPIIPWPRAKSQNCMSASRGR